MTNNTPNGMKKHHKSTEPESYQTAKMFLRRPSSKLHDPFTIVFTQNSTILHWAVYQPIAFSQLWSLTRWFKLVTEELWLHLRRHFLD